MRMLSKLIGLATQAKVRMVAAFSQAKQTVAQAVQAEDAQALGQETIVRSGRGGSTRTPKGTRKYRRFRRAQMQMQSASRKRNRAH